MKLSSSRPPSKEAELHAGKHVKEDAQHAVIERLLSEFTEVLRLEGKPDFSIVDRCPTACRRELLSLCNVAAMAYRALEPERAARRRDREKEKAAGS